MANTIDFKSRHRDFRSDGIGFSVSSRKISQEMTVENYLRAFYLYIDIRRIDDVFGSTCFPSQLYGGRSFNRNCSLTDRHIDQLEEMGIGIALTLSSHLFNQEIYDHSRTFLKQHHRKKNAVICANDELAKHIRQDFPDYTLKASIIKNIDTIEKIEQNLELYDMVTPPMDRNDDDGFLQGIREKKRVLLFANANCAYTCPARTCYQGFAQKNAGLKVTSVCSKHTVPRLELGDVFFDVKKFKEMGFNHFKLVPLAPPSARKVAVELSKKTEGKNA